MVFGIQKIYSNIRFAASNGDFVHIWFSGPSRFSAFFLGREEIGEIRIFREFREIGRSKRIQRIQRIHKALKSKPKGIIKAINRRTNRIKL